MAEPQESDALPQALVEPPRRRLSFVWIIPVLAAIVAIGIAVQRIMSEGPTITIVFAAAEGIEAGKTLIKYKDVNIGQVTAVHLTQDFTKVEVTAKIAKTAEGLMVDDAHFWIVRPSISLSGVSGLSTLLSGNYIGFEAGKSATRTKRFDGLDTAPFIVEPSGGRKFVLKADDLGSLAEGSPIYYRRLPVGQVVSYGLAKDGKSVEIQVFVRAPYDRWVTPATRFWKASGFDVSLDANGLEVRTESLVALLVGGLAFDSVPTLDSLEPAAENAAYEVYPDRARAMKAPDPVARRYVLHFDESIRGLSVGAPVTYLGLPAGEVTKVGLDLDRKTKRVRPRVVITFYPERLLAYFDDADDPLVKSTENNPELRRRYLRYVFEHENLRGQLRNGNLLTGQLYVAFEYFPNAPKVKIDWTQASPELPVVPGALVDLVGKLSTILDKIERLPLDEIGASLKADLDSLDKALVGANKLITNLDTELVPSLKTDLDGLKRVLDKTERTLDNANATLLSPDAPAQQELRDALTEFTRAARSLRVLLDYLERHPESPIRGKTEKK